LGRIEILSILRGRSPYAEIDSITGQVHVGINLQCVDHMRQLIVIQDHRFQLRVQNQFILMNILSVKDSFELNGALFNVANDFLHLGEELNLILAVDDTFDVLVDLINVAQVLIKLLQRRQLVMNDLGFFIILHLVLKLHVLILLLKLPVNVLKHFIYVGELGFFELLNFFLDFEESLEILLVKFLSHVHKSLKISDVGVQVLKGFIQLGEEVPIVLEKHAFATHSGIAISTKILNDLVRMVGTLVEGPSLRAIKHLGGSQGESGSFLVHSGDHVLHIIYSCIGCGDGVLLGILQVGSILILIDVSWLLIQILIWFFSRLKLRGRRISVEGLNICGKPL